MEYSSAEMTCVLKVNTQCEACKVKVMQVLQSVRGVYNITIDGEEGTVKVTGRVNPSTLLSVLEKYGKHAEVKYVKFDGEVVERNPRYYGEYAPYGMEYGSYPPLPCHQHQWYEPSFDFSQPPPPHPPPLAPYPVAPRPPPPAPYWPPPPPPPRRTYGPPPLTSFCMPRPPNHVHTGETSRQNKQSHCAMM